MTDYAKSSGEVPYKNKYWASLTEERREKQRAAQRAWYQKNKDRAKKTNAECARKRKERDPETYLAKANEKSKRHYHKNIEKGRERSRECARKRRMREPDVVKAIKFRNQYGITVEERNALFESQGFVCAICKSDDPGSKAGWNTDHCHSTGVVRFILCAHCNRGLGAFKDNPETMRRAAEMLESFYSKERGPQKRGWHDPDQHSYR